jgi:hypothetical protein
MTVRQRYGTVMAGVLEYAEGYEVELVESECGLSTGRLVLKAFNEGGHNFTEVDLLHVLEWVRQNRPGLLGVSE